MKRLLLVAILAALVAVSSFGTVLARPQVPPPTDIAKAVFIHYKAPAKPVWAGPKKSSEDEGYKLFRGGVKWADTALPVSYSINTASVPWGIDPSAAASEIIASFEKWDDNTSKELFNNTVGTTAIAVASLDSTNAIAWAALADLNTIAVTTFWYYRSTKELVEFDILFNTQFTWGIDLDGEDTAYSLVGAMDIRNIATHESGHALVLEDLYQDKYTGMTMYGYSAYDEVEKISLELGDIAGLHKLYGE